MHSYCTNFTDINTRIKKQLKQQPRYPQQDRPQMQKFRKLDIFKKVPKDLSQGTNLGGLISVITALLIIYFTFTEIYTFFNQPQVANINLDEPFTRKQLTINLDIEFPRFPCEIISLDLQDEMMSHHPNIGSVKKFRLDADGRYVDSGDFQLLREPDQMRQFQIAQEAFQKQYGCRVKGSFTVKQVPGNFHISSHAYQNIYIRLAMSGTIKTLDVSHKIHELYFGQISKIDSVQKAHPQAQLTPLNGHSRIYDMKTPHSYNSHYHIDIVPTIYGGSLTQTSTYQYTYNHNTFEVNHMPALYFNYHIGGTRVSVSSRQGPVSTFILNMCAVIGGIYALAHFLYNTLFALLGTKIGYQELGQ